MYVFCSHLIDSKNLTHADTAVIALIFFCFHTFLAIKLLLHTLCHSCAKHWARSGDEIFVDLALVSQRIWSVCSENTAVSYFLYHTHLCPENFSFSILSCSKWLVAATSTCFFSSSHFCSLSNIRQNKVD